MKMCQKEPSPLTHSHDVAFAVGAVVHVLEFGGGAVLRAFEDAVEGGDAREAGLDRHVRDGHGRIQEQAFGFLYLTLVQVVVERLVRVLLKQTREVEFAETCYAGDILERDVLREVLINVIEDDVEFVDVLHLLMAARFRKISSVRIDELAADDDIHFEDLCVDRCGFQRHRRIGEILRLDLEHDALQGFVDVGRRFRSEKTRTVCNADDLLEIPQVVDDGEVELQDQAHAGLRRDQLVQLPRRDADHVEGLQVIFHAVNDDRVVVFDRHDVLETGVPMDRIVLRYVVSVQQNRVRIVVFNRFKDTV